MKFLRLERRLKVVCSDGRGELTPENVNTGRWSLQLYVDEDVTVLELYYFIKSILEWANNEEEVVVKKVSVNVLGASVVIDQQTTIEEYLIAVVGNVCYDSFGELSRAE